MDITRLQDFIPFDTMPTSYLKDLQSCFSVHQVASGKVIYKRGQKLSDVYYLFSGTVDLADANFEIKKLEADDVENYLAFETAEVAAVSAITTSECVVVTISKEKLAMLERMQDASDLMEESHDDEEVDWMEALLSLEIFRLIPPANIQNLFTRFEEIEAEMGQDIIKQDEDGDRFYVIKSGRAIVSRDAHGSPETIATLKPGQYFGQDALIERNPRNATVTMVTPGTLMCLNRDDFSELLHQATQKIINEEELQTMIDEADTGTVIVDVRSASEFKHDSYPGSINIPVLEMREKLKELEKNFTYVVVCDGSRRAELGAYLLTEAGINALLLDHPGRSDSDESADNTEQGDQEHTADS